MSGSRPLRWLTALCLLVLPAGAEVPAVVTDMPPVHSLVAAVMGDLGTPAVLVRGSADPHHVQLRPSQARAIARADLIVWIGPQMTPWLARALDGIGGDARSLILLDAPGTTQRAPAFASGVGDQDHADLHSGTRDPHAWLDPENALLWTALIAEALAAADPEHAETYRANAANARAEIAAATAHARALLDTPGDRPLVVYHDAYVHFAQRFGLHLAGALTDSEASAPGAASVAALRAVLASGDVACALGDAQQNPDLLRRLARETGVRFAVLDPMGATLAPGPALYGQLIEAMAQTIATCGAD